MSSSPSVLHAFLRPAILQILRATGYHSTRPTVLDSLTDLAARYLVLLCERTASSAVHNHGDPRDYDVADIRIALQDVGALPPEKVTIGKVSRDRDRDREEGEGEEEEDIRGVEEFIQWFAGDRMKVMMEMSSGDGELDATDYLAALKKKHSKTGDDAKWQGTIFGKCNDTGEIQIEGGAITSINEWISMRSLYPEEEKKGENGNGMNGMNGENGNKLDDRDSRAPSSGLSSVGDRVGDDDEMVLT